MIHIQVRRQDQASNSYLSQSLRAFRMAYHDHIHFVHLGLLELNYLLRKLRHDTLLEALVVRQGH